MVLGIVSRLLHCVLRSLGDWLPVSCCSFEAKLIVRGDYLNCLCEASLVGDKMQNNSLLSMSATLASLYKGLLCFSVLTYIVLLESSNLPHGNQEQSIFAVWSRLPIKWSYERKNNRRTHVCTVEWCEDVNVCTSERSCDGMKWKLFLFSATVWRQCTVVSNSWFKEGGSYINISKYSEICGFKNHLSN